MVVGKYQYPEDPVEVFELMYGIEFSQLRGRGVIRIHSLDAEGNITNPTQIEFDEIICDSCNEEVHATDPCVRTVAQLLCFQCGKKYVLKYLLPETLTIR